MTAKNESSSGTAGRELTLSRIFDAPRELVWKAMTDPKQVVQWWGPYGFKNTIETMDLRPGGVWHHVMQAPNGMRITIDSLFEEVVKPERLVWRTAKVSGYLFAVDVITEMTILKKSPRWLTL